jgi:putative Holliday junction resolvase
VDFPLRILAVDPGDVRIGLALSDPSGILANPLTILQHESRAADAARIADLAGEHEVKLIVVGHPVDAEDSSTPQSRKAKRLAAAIRDATLLPVVLWDESGSSQSAHKTRRNLGLGRKKRAEPIDALAATVILQTYLDQHDEDPASE